MYAYMRTCGSIYALIKKVLTSTPEARRPVVRFRVVAAYNPHEGRLRKGRTRGWIKMGRVVTGQSASRDLGVHSRESKRHTEEDENIAPAPWEREPKLFSEA